MDPRTVRSLRRTLVAVCLAGVFTYVIALARVAGLGYQTPPEHADAAIVLGAAVWNGGRPSPVLQRRCATAATLLRNHRVAWLATTGGLGHQPPTEAESARSYLVHDLGVDRARVLGERCSHDTFDNLRDLRPVLTARGIRRVFVVSDGYHLARAVRMARDLGYEAWGVPVEASPWTSVTADPVRWAGEARWMWLYSFGRVFSTVDRAATVEPDVFTRCTLPP